MESAMTATNDLVLSREEIINITHRKRPVEQLRDLIALGIPATRRHDNTICVLRADVTTRRVAANAPESRPQRKSAK
jgi:hypothetical protein